MTTKEKAIQLFRYMKKNRGVTKDRINKLFGEDCATDVLNYMRAHGVKLKREYDRTAYGINYIYRLRG